MYNRHKYGLGYKIEFFKKAKLFSRVLAIIRENDGPNLISS